MRTEERRIEREIRQIQMEQKKKEGDLRAVAKRGDQASMLILTKALVQSRGTVNRLYTSKANLISMQTHLQAQLATLKVSKTLSASTEVLSVVNTLIRIPEMREATKRLSKEMYKAGILGEMVEDTFEDMGDDVSMEVRSTADPRVVIAKERWSGSGMFLPDVAHSSSLGMFHCRRRKRCKRSLWKWRGMCSRSSRAACRGPRRRP
jgi:division protein CdvB (Snf7/Vps24/ESCRT-III family)